MRRLAIVLFNLGGPDCPEAVRPFLFNLFNDPAIIGAPGPLRWALAKLISARRAPLAKAIYEKIGGRSPIVPLTQQQASALEERLMGKGEWDQARVFVAMRYWHPRAHDVVREVANFDPDQVVLLPLYPQFSTTTSGSSLKEWGEAAQEAGLTAPSASVCCHPLEKHFIGAHRQLLAAALETAGGPEGARVLFSAHGLPKKISESGDPYQWQVKATVSALVRALDLGELDWQICYQSRLGPLEWIGPSTEAEITRAGADGKSVVLVPIAFVSEHSETLVELDIENRKLAENLGVPTYVRVPALAVTSSYIEALARIALEAAGRGKGIGPGGAAARLCPAEFTRCPFKVAALSG
ncbi:ferrochelatase [bacterium AH-315-P15]|nr:ferrochelatase [bacterium AH-315-P15]